MGIGDRIAARALTMGGNAAEAVGNRAQHVSAGFRGLRALLMDDGESASIESALVALVRAVRDDEADEDRSARDVFESARSRRRRLGVASFGAGAMVGVATHLVDLYCETATMCDLADVHALELSEHEIAAHMLVLWTIVESFEDARSMMSGSSERTVAAVIADQLNLGGVSHLSQDLTTRAAAKALWEARGLLGDVRRATSADSVRGVVFAGHRTKQLIKRAESQLGLR